MPQHGAANEFHPPCRARLEAHGPDVWRETYRHVPPWNASSDGADGGPRGRRDGYQRLVRDERDEAAARYRGLPAHPEQFAGFNTVLNRNGAWTGAGVQALVADSTRIRIGVRQDITVKFLDQATVGGINLAERDMVALRFKARYAYVLGKHATSLGVNKTPVAALVNSGS